MRNTITVVRAVSTIKWQYLETYQRAIEAKLPTDNINIYLRSDIKKALGLSDRLVFGGNPITYEAAVIVDDSIEEKESQGDEFYSSFYIYDPAWE